MTYFPGLTPPELLEPRKAPPHVTPAEAVSIALSLLPPSALSPPFHVGGIPVQLILRAIEQSGWAIVPKSDNQPSQLTGANKS